MSPVSSATVNVTCTRCDGNSLCADCRATAKTLSQAGFQPVHSTRYAALSAAVRGTYAFEACVVPLGADEPAVLDALRLLLAGKRVAIVGNRLAADAHLPAEFSVFPSRRLAPGSIAIGWLSAGVGQRRPPTSSSDQ